MSAIVAVCLACARVQDSKETDGDKDSGRAGGAKAGLAMLSSLIGSGSAEGFKLNLFPEDVTTGGGSK